MAKICTDSSHSGTKRCWTCKGRGAPSSMSARSKKDAVCSSCNGTGIVCEEDGCGKPKS